MKYFSVKGCPKGILECRSQTHYLAGALLTLFLFVCLAFPTQEFIDFKVIEPIICQEKNTSESLLPQQ